MHSFQASTLILFLGLTKTRRILKELKEYVDKTCYDVGPCKLQLTWGSLRRCLTCIESAVNLLSQGYIGSVNALLRQIYEFLAWAKLGIHADDKTIIKLSGYFYDYSLGRSHPVTKILKHTTVEDIEGSLTGADLAESGQQMYHRFSFLTHATGLAQQCPYKTDDFYNLLNDCFLELVFFIDAYSIVLLQYFSRFQSKLNHETSVCDQGSKAMLRSMALNYCTRKMWSLQSKIDDLEHGASSMIPLLFVPKWHIDGDRV